MGHPSRKLAEAVDFAAAKGVLIVAAAGNESRHFPGSLTTHPWVIPVVACDSTGRPLEGSVLGRSIGRQGFSAYGDHVVSLKPGGGITAASGSSASAAIVTGILAIAWCLHPDLDAWQVRYALTRHPRRSPQAVVPPVLDGTAF